jgi:hypothetical protein
MHLILGNYVRKIIKNRKYVIKRQVFYSLLAYEIVQSDWNLLTIFKKLLPSYSGTRRYVLFLPKSRLYFISWSTTCHHKTIDCIFTIITKNRFRILKHFISQFPLVIQRSLRRSTANVHLPAAPSSMNSCPVYLTQGSILCKRLRKIDFPTLTLTKAASYRNTLTCLSMGCFTHKWPSRLTHRHRTTTFIIEDFSSNLE